MDWLAQLIEFVLHLDVHIADLATAYGPWLYLLLFVIIFAETGLVVTPFLPGDSLLFATGAIAATGGLNPHTAFVLVAIAAILGDTANYWIGNFIGPKIFSKEKSLLFNPEHLKQTHTFYERYGGKTIIIARFIPIIRTFAPFVAGIGKMSYARFIAYNIVGGLLWVAGFIYTGFFFGNLPFIKKNFSLVIFAIIILSVMPAVIEFAKEFYRKRRLSQLA